MESQRDSNLRLPLTWGIGQKESFQKYLMQNAHVDFIYKGVDYHADVQEAMIFNQGIAAVANLINKSIRGTNMLVDIGKDEVANPEGLQVRFADRTGRIENSSGAPV